MQVLTSETRAPPKKPLQVQRRITKRPTPVRSPPLPQLPRTRRALPPRAATCTPAPIPAGDGKAPHLVEPHLEGVRHFFVHLARLTLPLEVPGNLVDVLVELAGLQPVGPSPGLGLRVRRLSAGPHYDHRRDSDPARGGKGKNTCLDPRADVPVRRAALESEERALPLGLLPEQSIPLQVPSESPVVRHGDCGAEAQAGDGRECPARDADAAEELDAEIGTGRGRVHGPEEVAVLGLGEGEDGELWWLVEILDVEREEVERSY